MVTLNECIGMSGLDEEVIDAIAQHQHIPEIVAAELGAALITTSEGCTQIRRMIAERADNDMRSGQRQRAASLRRALSRFDGNSTS